MRLIDADKLLESAMLMQNFWNFYDNDSVSCVTEHDIESAPTIDPETLRPTAHIMRGTVPDTHDDAFCSNCRLYLGVLGFDYEDYDTVLSHRYKYCPHCGARFVGADE